MFKFIDNYDLILNEAISKKIESVVSGIKNNSANIQHNNQLTTDNINNNTRINQHLASHTNLIIELSSKLDTLSCVTSADVSSSKTFYESLIAQLEKELRTTSDACHELTNSLSCHKSTVTTDRPNTRNLHQELHPAPAISKLYSSNSTTLSSHEVPANIDTNPGYSQHSSGTSNVNVPFTLTTVPRPKSIFVSRLSNSTTNADVLSHVKLVLNQHNVQVQNVHCKNITRLNGHVASFKLTIPEAMFDLLLSPKSWPETTYIKEFVDFRSSNINPSVPKNLNACPSTTRT